VWSRFFWAHVNHHSQAQNITTAKQKIVAIFLWCLLLFLDFWLAVVRSLLNHERMRTAKFALQP